MKSRYYSLCAASGGVWAAIAYVIGHQPLPRGIIWGGIVVSPLIGLAVGAVYRPAYRSSATARVAMSLLTLYVAAALFGLAVGVFDAGQGVYGAGTRSSGEVICQGLVGTVWGLTFTGYVVILWPLAHLNHRLVGRLARPPDETSQRRDLLPTAEK